MVRSSSCRGAVGSGLLVSICQRPGEVESLSVQGVGVEKEESRGRGGKGTCQGTAEGRRLGEREQAPQWIGSRNGCEDRWDRRCNGLD